MNKCPITYENCGDVRYSSRGLNLLSGRLNELHDFPYDQEHQLIEAGDRAYKMSIQGVQPKLSAILSIKDSSFKIVDRGGTFIIKPQVNNYLNVPENEDLTMKLAAAAGIETPLHGLIWSVDGSLSYFIKRFDRIGRKGKVQQEDFAQLSGASRHTKYDSSLEQVAQVIDRYCTFPIPEKAKLFRLVLFNYLVGNEDNHLKNYSLITRKGVVGLSPAYDLVSTSLLYRTEEETALPLKGKKRELTYNDLFKYFGQERLGLQAGVLEQMRLGLLDVQAEWQRLIASSFLTEGKKEEFLRLLGTRVGLLK